jgi:hypothetical protein
MRFLAMIPFLFSAPAFATVSTCVLYIENTGATPVSVQASCDGAELKQIFEWHQRGDLEGDSILYK